MSTWEALVSSRGVVAAGRKVTEQIGNALLCASIGDRVGHASGDGAGEAWLIAEHASMRLVVNTGTQTETIGHEFEVCASRFIGHLEASFFFGSKPRNENAGLLGRS